MSDDNLFTVDSDEFDPDELDSGLFGSVPTERVRIMDSMDMMKPSQNGGTPQQMNDYFDVEVPDMERINDYLKGKYSIDSPSQLNFGFEQRKRAVQKKAWDAIREIGQASDLKHYDATGDQRFMDTMYDAVHTLEQQGGAPEDAEVFIHPKTNAKVRQWMEHDIRLNSPTDDMVTAKTIEVAGFQFQFLETEFLKRDEMVLADTEIHASPQSKPFTFVTNLPVGIEVTIKVNGRDNEIEVDR
jgi:hypothetical protein